MTGNVPTTQERLRAQRCMELRLGGNTWQSIADTEGYTDRSGPRLAVQRLLDRTGAELVTEYREVELARLDKLLSAHWTAAVGGDIKSAELVLKVSAQRSRLLGLNTPERLIVTETGGYENFAETAAALLCEIGLRPPTPAPTTQPIGDDDGWSNIGES